MEAYVSYDLLVVGQIGEFSLGMRFPTGCSRKDRSGIVPTDSVREL